MRDFFSEARAFAAVARFCPFLYSAQIKVNGSMRVVDQESGEDLDPQNKKVCFMSFTETDHGASVASATCNLLQVSLGGPSGPLSDQPPEVGAVLAGKVKRIEPYGVVGALPSEKVTVTWAYGNAAIAAGTMLLIEGPSFPLRGLAEAS